MQNELVFDEKQNVMKIDLETLESTADYVGSNKHERSHHAIIREMVDDLNGRGYVAKLDELYIAKPGVIYPTQREVDTKGYLASTVDTRGVIVKNLIAKINLGGDLANDVNNASIAIAYNNSGIAMSAGTNIGICSNMNIFGGNLMQNYGKTQMPLMRMMEIMATWIQNMQQIRERDLFILDGLSSINISGMSEIDEAIGQLHRLCEMQKDNKDIVSPMSHSRIHELQRGMLDHFDKGVLMATAYDFYQAATQVTTHQSTLDNRMINTSSIGTYFTTRYGLNPAIAEAVDSSVIIQ